MKKINKTLSIILIFSFGIGIVFATNNFFRQGYNWDANVVRNSDEDNPNDIFILDGRIDLEDSRSERYINDGFRGTITGIVDSELFGRFLLGKSGALINELELYYKTDDTSSYYCGGDNPLEIYTMSGMINSPYWGEMEITPSSYFCSNQYMYLQLNSNTLGYKEIGVGNGITQTGIIDNFGKQEIYIKGIAKLKGKDGKEILNRGDGDINVLGVYNDIKTLVNTNINKNIENLFETFKNDGIKYSSETINSFTNNDYKLNKYYLYNLTNESLSPSNKLNFNSTNDYINDGGIIQIGNNPNDIISIIGKNTLITRGGNIYINSNLTNFDSYGKDNGNNLLILIAKKDKDKKKGGNIYINPNVTNIDAVLIADGSLISLNGNDIQKVTDSNQVNNLRKQLLIYGSVFSSNSIGIDEIPYGADYYKYYLNNEISGSIYDLGNLRTFNVNYGSGDIDGDGEDDNTKLVPINGMGGYLKNAWAGQCEWFNGIECNLKLRETDKRNPVVIKYNTNIKRLDPFVLRK